MRGHVFRLALGALAAMAAVAQAGAPWDTLQTVWEARADGVFRPLPPLGEGLALVQNHVSDPATGKEAPELSLLDVWAGQPKWTIPTGSDVMSVAVAGDLIVLGTRTAPGPATALVAARSVSKGEVVCQVPLEHQLDVGGGADGPGLTWGQWGSSIGQLGSPEMSNPAGIVVRGDRVFVKVEGRVFCLARATGDVLWGRAVGYSLTAPLTPHGTLLLAACQSEGLYALDQETGRVLWTTPAEHIRWIYSVADSVFVLTHDDWLARVDPARGAPMWQVSVSPGSEPYVDVVGPKVVVRGDGRARILDLATGAEEYAAPAMYADVLDGVLYHQAPDVADGPRAWPSDLIAVGIADHQQKWRVSARELGVFWGCRAGVLLMSFAGDVRALRPGDGGVLWEWNGPVAQGFVNGWSVTTEGSRILFHTDQQLVGFDNATGACFLEAPGDYRSCRGLRLRGDALCLRYLEGSAGNSLVTVRLTKG